MLILINKHTINEEFIHNRALIFNLSAPFSYAKKECPYIGYHPIEQA